MRNRIFSCTCHAYFTGIDLIWYVRILNCTVIVIVLIDDLYLCEECWNVPITGHVHVPSTEVDVL